MSTYKIEIKISGTIYNGTIGASGKLLWGTPLPAMIPSSRSELNRCIDELRTFLSLNGGTYFEIKEE